MIIEPDLERNINSTVQTSLINQHWILIGTTVQGSHHLSEGVPCEDAHAISSIGDVLLIAVADGLGSAPQAGCGALLAVQEALDTARNSLFPEIPDNKEKWANVLKTSFSNARMRLEQEAEHSESPLADFSTTLNLILLTSEWLAIANIGDGAVILQDADGLFSTICLPQVGEYANETLSLCLSDALNLTGYQVNQIKVQALGIISDGLQHLSLHTVDFSPHIPFFAPLFSQLSKITNPKRAAESLAGFLSSGKVNELSGDDKTLILVGRLNNG